jgi:hypothetical protein
MLYLIQPDRTMKWTNLPRATLALAKGNGADLGELAWVDVEEEHPIDDVVRVALRHGHACSRGLVLDAGYVLDLKRPNDLRIALAESKRARGVIAESDRLMESMAPGWTEHGQLLDEQMEAVMKQHIERADAERARLLVNPVVDHLLAHWERGTDFLPEPL